MATNPPMKKIKCFFDLHDWGIKLAWIRERVTDPLWLVCRRCGRGKIHDLKEGYGYPLP